MSRLSRGFETEQTPAFDFMLKKNRIDVLKVFVGVGGSLQNAVFTMFNIMCSYILSHLKMRRHLQKYNMYINNFPKI